MKKRFFRLIFSLLLIGGLFYFSGKGERSAVVKAVKAASDLIVDFHTDPPGGPIFTLENLKPSDEVERLVDITNNGAVARFIGAKGKRVSGAGGDPKIETVLQLTIADESTPVYGPKTLADFFSQSDGSESGIPLNILPAGAHKTYNIRIKFPASAGDEFQAKSVRADLSFGIITAKNLVINEVYYNAKYRHFLAELFDLIDKDNLEEKFLKFEQKRIFRRQWVEIYNPTGHDISLKNWSLTDNSGKKTVIHANKKIKAGGFALLSKSAFIWWFWRPPKSATKVELGRIIGNGLDIGGDRLILKNPKGEEIDKISWGSDRSVFDPSIPVVGQGQSSQRQVPGFDNDLASDWLVGDPPTPGR